MARRVVPRAVRDVGPGHPHEWGLIFGSPVPGYQARTDTVTPYTRLAASPGPPDHRGPRAREPRLAPCVARRTGHGPAGPGRRARDRGPSPRPPHRGGGAGAASLATLIGIISLELFGHWRNTVLEPERSSVRPYVRGGLSRGWSEGWSDVRRRGASPAVVQWVPSCGTGAEAGDQPRTGSFDLDAVVGQEEDLVLEGVLPIDHVLVELARGRLLRTCARARRTPGLQRRAGPGTSTGSGRRSAGARRPPYPRPARLRAGPDTIVLSPVVRLDDRDPFRPTAGRFVAPGTHPR